MTLCLRLADTASQRGLAQVSSMSNPSIKSEYLAVWLHYKGPPPPPRAQEPHKRGGVHVDDANCLECLTWSRLGLQLGIAVKASPNLAIIRSGRKVTCCHEISRLATESNCSRS